MYQPQNMSAASRPILQASAAPDGGLAGAMATGHILAGMDRLIHVSELHGRGLQDLADTQRTVVETLHKMADTLGKLADRPAPTACPHPVKPDSDRLTFPERMQLTALAVALAGVLAGKLPLAAVFKTLGVGL